jgi:hypothetical protein
MKALLAWLLPPLVALAGMRMNEWLFTRPALARHGAGLRFAWGLGTGMLIFSQLVVLGAVVGVPLATLLAWTGLGWGAVEFIVRLRHAWPALANWRPKRIHLWWLTLAPVAVALGLTGLLATVEGTLEFDALAFWVFKAKVMFLKQGADFAAVHQNPLLTYAHWDYPLLVPGLYTLNYGLHGEVFEFTNKVWPFWMVTAFLIAILSVSRFFVRPRLLPVAVVTAVCFVPFTTYWIRMEGATVPMMFYTSLAALTATLWLLDRAQLPTAGVAVLLLAGCAATKFEGVVNVMFWGSALAWFLHRDRAWGQRPVWLSLGMAAAGLLPYALFRLSGPLPHPQSGWLAYGLDAPGETLARVPWAVLLNFGHRFFSATAFAWKPTDSNGLEWAGRWDGWNTFVDEHTHVLAWMVLLLAPFSMWRRPANRQALVALSLVCLGTMLFLCGVIACLPESRTSAAGLNEFAAGMVARYFFPMLAAWFVGLMLPWMVDLPPGHAPTEAAALTPLRVRPSDN